MNRATTKVTLATIVATINTHAHAKPGDKWCYITPCAAVGGGPGKPVFGRGTCATNSARMQDLGATIKECTDFTETGLAPTSPNYEAVLLTPGGTGGNVIQLSPPGSAYTPVFVMGQGPRLLREDPGGDGIQIASLPLPPEAENPEDILSAFFLTPEDPPSLSLFMEVFPEPATPTIYLYTGTFAAPVPHAIPIDLTELTFIDLDAPCSIADLDIDNDIDVFDLILFLQSFDPGAQCPDAPTCEIADRDGDNDIDVFDLITFLQNFNPENPNCHGQ